MISEDINSDIRALDEFIQAIRYTLDNHRDIVFIKNLDFEYVYVNQEFLGINKEDNPLGKTDYDFEDKRDAEKYRKTDLEVLSGNTAEYEAEVHTRTGNISHYSSFISLSSY